MREGQPPAPPGKEPQAIPFSLGRAGGFVAAALTLGFPCGGPAGGDPAPAPDPIVARCAELCADAFEDGCHADEAGCRADCEIRFATAACASAAEALLDCYAAEAAPDCAPPSACGPEAGSYLACRGALGCTDTLSCEPASSGCDCLTSCVEYTIETRCRPDEARCDCILGGPLGVGTELPLTVACASAEPTNKWCQGLPFGCCEALF